MFKRAAVLVVSCGALVSGCGTDAADSRSEHEEIISNLIEAGFPADDILVADGKVYTGRDVHVSLAASRELLQPGEGSQEQYRTTNLVSTATVKKICINPTATFNSYPRLSQGLDMAIENYNALGLCFSMARGPPPAVARPSPRRPCLASAAPRASPPAAVPTEPSTSAPG